MNIVIFIFRGLSDLHGVTCVNSYIHIICGIQMVSKTTAHHFPRLQIERRGTRPGSTLMLDILRGMKEVLV